MDHDSETELYETAKRLSLPVLCSSTSIRDEPRRGYSENQSLFWVGGQLPDPVYTGFMGNFRLSLRALNRPSLNTALCHIPLCRDVLAKYRESGWYLLKLY